MKRVRNDQSWYLGEDLAVRIWPPDPKIPNGGHTRGSITQTNHHKKIESEP